MMAAVQPQLIEIRCKLGREVRHDKMQHHDSGVKRVESVRALLMSPQHTPRSFNVMKVVATRRIE
jgi:hypothetical protein